MVKRIAPAAAAILDAAEELFATRGFARTTIKDIGRAAGVNPALLYYYYGDKTGLYRAALTRIGTELERRAMPALEAKSVDAMIAGIIDAQATMLARHPRAAALVIRELLDHDATHGHGMMEQLAADLFRPACAVIEAGKRRGEIRADLDSRYAAISTISQLVYFTLAKAAVRILLGKAAGFPTAADTAEFAKHAARFAQAGMAAVPARRRIRG